MLGLSSALSSFEPFLQTAYPESAPERTVRIQRCENGRRVWCAISELKLPSAVGARSLADTLNH